MRTLDATTQAEIAKKLGTEPINVVAIDWTRSESWVYYADKDVSDFSGKILELGTIDNVLSSDTGTSFSVSLTLDDTDGTIKSIMDSTDVHKVDCVIYQHFGDLDVAHKFLLFNGQLSSPFSWNEGDRTFKCTIVTNIEDKEVGFSPEEAQFDFVSKDAIGKAWPLAFGNVLHVPATKIKSVLTGTLLDHMCIVDPGLNYILNRLKDAYHQEQIIKTFFEQVITGANTIAPTVTDIITEYIDLIKQQRNLLWMIAPFQVEIERARRQLNDIANPVDAALRAFLEAVINQNLLLIQNVINGPMAAIIASIKQVEEWIELAKFRYDIKKDAYNKILEAVDNMYTIQAQYIDVQNELCRQNQCVKTSVKIDDGNDFTQNETVELLIDGLKWRGQFSGKTFTFDTPGIPENIYENLPVTWQEDPDYCGVVTEHSGIDKFWVANSEINLKDMYCLVTSRNDDFRHIIKVTHQEGTKCTFNLIAVNYGGGNTNLLQSLVTLPQYGSPFGPINVNIVNIVNPSDYNQPIQSLNNTILEMLDGTIPNEEEFRNLAELQRIWPNDIANDALIISTPTPRDNFTIIGEDIDTILAVSKVPLWTWFDEDDPILIEEIPDNLHWAVTPGTTVRDANSQHEIYVANILPSTIKGVHAYRTHDSKRILQPVPIDYYSKNESEDILDIGGNTILEVTSLRFNIPLNEFADEGWEDQIYVTLDSSVGPKTVDILKHLIDVYTDFTYDNTSFNAVDTAFGTKYPSSFALFDRKNVMQQLSEIAWQARCVIWLSNGVFYLKYLSEEPTSIATITESDIELSSLEVDHGATEDLITKMNIAWRDNYLPNDPYQIILRHNVKKYGLQDQDYDFYIYNIQDLVIKSATFWLIRNANTWKHITFTTFLTNLEVETFDALTFDFSTNFIADGNIKGVIEQADYDSSSHRLNISAWLPVRAGEMSEYTFAWPASAAENDVFPTVNEVSNGYAGGDGIGITIVTSPEGE
jgi:hypothetical protein